MANLLGTGAQSDDTIINTSPNYHLKLIGIRSDGPVKGLLIRGSAKLWRQWGSFRQLDLASSCRADPPGISGYSGLHLVFYENDHLRLQRENQWETTPQLLFIYTNVRKD